MSAPHRADIDPDQPTAEDMVADILRRWPETLRVFLDHHMACGGCPMSPYETVSEAAANYGLCRDQLIADLIETITDNRRRSERSEQAFEQ